MLKTHIICRVLAALLCLSMVLFSAFGAGLSCLTAYADTLEKIHIASIEDWNAFASACVLDTWSAGIEAKLEADLNFAGEAFVQAPLFAGHFDGNGHTIAGISLTEDASTAGLFRQILAGGIVENLNVSGNFTPGGTAEKIGSLAGVNLGTIRNCAFEGAVEARRLAGGICGLNGASGRIENCGAQGLVLAQHEAGGICGKNEGSVTDCENAAEVNTRPVEADALSVSSLDLSSLTAASSAEEIIDVTNIGGIAGSNSGTIAGCTNKANVGYSRIGYNVGGIAGASSGRIEACANSGKVQGRKDAGGIAGQLDPDAGWNFSQSSLADLADRLDALKLSMDGLLADASSAETNISSDTQALMDAAAAVRKAAETLFEDGSALINANLNSVNSLLGILDEAAEDLAPAGRKFSTFTGDLSSAYRSLQNAKGFAESAVETGLEDGLSGLDDVKSSLKEAYLNVSNAGIDLGNSLKDLKSASGGLYWALKDFDDQEMPSFYGIDTENDALDELSRALKSAETAAQAMKDDLDGFDLGTRLQSVSDRLFSVSDFAVDMMRGGSDVDPAEYVEDVSASGTLRSAGVVTGCRNTGPVSAETNAGGIAGAVSIELAFDPESEMDVSSLLSGGARYMVYAAIADCSNAGSVYAKKTAAGGIAGRMDYGAVSACSSAADVSTEGSYAGGIAGFSAGTITGCSARSVLAALSHQGGIAGQGADISDCFAMPYFESAAEFTGSIAGSASGQVLRSFYSGSDAGGVDGFSFAGQTEPLTYEEFVSRAGDPSVFETVRVTFASEDGKETVIDVPFGGRVEKLPEIADKDGKCWQWDDFGNEHIFRSLRVEGRYVSPVTTLSSGEDVPEILVEGLFTETQSLKVSDALAEAEDALPEETDLRAARLTVDGYGGILRVRLRESSGGTLYIKGEDSWIETDFARDGSYIVFEMENCGSFAFARRAPIVSHTRALIGGAAALAAVIAFLALRARKKE